MKFKTKKLIIILPSIIAILLVAGFVYAAVCDNTTAIAAPTNLTYIYQQDKTDPTIVYATLNWDIPDDFPVSDELDRPFPTEPISQAGFKIDCQFAGEAKPTTALIAPPTDTESEFHQGGAFQFPVKANTSGWCEVRSTNTAGELSDPTKVNITTDLPQITNIITNNNIISYQTKTATTSNIFYHTNNSLVTDEKSNMQTADYTPNTSIFMEEDASLAASHSLNLKSATSGKYYTFITATDKYGNTAMSNIFAVDAVIQPATLKGKVMDANGKPIAFASVALPSKGSDYTGVTFLDGTYIISNIPLTEGQSQESVSATASYSQEPTCPSQTLTPILQSGQTTTQDFQLNCRPEVLALGTITDQTTGQPIAGATVNIDKPTPTTITANSQGQFIIPCNPTSPCPTSGINFTLTASSSADFNSQSIMLNYAKYTITTNFALIPVSRSTTDNTPPAITKLTYQKQTYKMYFWWQAKDKEDASKKIKYSYKLDKGSWSAWDSNIIKDFDLSGLKSNPTTFAIKAKDSNNLESSVQELKIKKTW